MKNFYYAAALTFAEHITPPDEIVACRKICESRGLTLRVRPYESN